jgi:hypothetical protein
MVYTPRKVYSMTYSFEFASHHNSVKWNFTLKIFKILNHDIGILKVKLNAKLPCFNNFSKGKM